MHVLTGVLLVLVAIFYYRRAAHRLEGKGEDCYRAALAADTDAGRQFQLARFIVFKAHTASHYLLADMCFIAAFVDWFLFDPGITAEVHAFWAGLP
jgi:hypothetical protein